MPYLVYAQKMAIDGVFGHFGDRNRMPLIPAITSLVYHEDWEIFYHRAARLAIAVSAAISLGIWFLARRRLEPWLAVTLALIFAVAVVLPQASFLQADVPYYAMFFFSWRGMIHLIEKPRPSQAVVVGILMGFTYLTKASVLLAVPILVTLLALRALASGEKPEESRLSSSNRTRFLGAAIVASVVFLLVVSPYLLSNHGRFGRFFYNVNTTFFVWCDSWAQAQHFAERYQIDQHYPDAPADQIPGMLNYFRTHSAIQIAQRLIYGMRTLTQLLLESVALKYVVILAAYAVLLTIKQWEAAKEILRRHKWAVGFSVLLFALYILAYSWYVLVAFGDRFILSLVTPILFGLLLYVSRLSALQTSPRRLRQAGIAGILLLGFSDTLRAAFDPTPPPNFVHFYYDETREELRRGNLIEAQRGFRGILSLDPNFAAAHLDLGMIALSQGRHAAAIESLVRATALEPGWADAHNSLGSAYLQSGRLTDAVASLSRAVEINPQFPPAWYNLCGTLFQLGETEKAGICVSRLEALAPELAARVHTVFSPSIAPKTGN